MTHPRETLQVFGHETSEREFMETLKSGKMHHAWILGGLEGIGKATLAYRLIYQLFNDVTLQPHEKLDENNANYRKVMALSHPNLLTLERPLETTATGLTRDIKAETVRKIHAFFGSTAGEGGWRVCLVDALEDLNATGTNALLKMVEEPPNKAIFIIISHNISQILPTIRSRSRLLKLKPLDNNNLNLALRPFDLVSNDDAEGSVKNALLLNSDEAQKVLTLTKQAIESKSLSVIHSLAELLAKQELTLLDIMVREIEKYLNSKMQVARQLQNQAGTITHLYETWQKINEELAKTKALNLDRKAFVFAVFKWIYQKQ